MPSFLTVDAIVAIDCGLAIGVDPKSSELVARAGGALNSLDWWRLTVNAASSQQGRSCRGVAGAVVISRIGQT